MKYSSSEAMDVLDAVLRRIKPGLEERRRVGKVAARVLSETLKLIKEFHINATPEYHGSYAKDTWTSSNADLDLFILFPSFVPLEDVISKGLTLAWALAKRLRARAQENYASHPYLELEVDRVRVDVVPAYKVSSVEEIKTPVDRTRLHTIYVLRNLPRKARDDVRLLKQFMRGIGVYGAEIKVQGFSGYLAELLVVAFGSFISTLKNAAEWRPFKTVIDIEGYYPGRAIPPKMRGPLVVVDPVDPNRNAAAAVSLESMARFIAAARLFIRKPSLSFFFPALSSPTISEIQQIIRSRGTHIFALSFPKPSFPEDAVWGQLRRSERGIRKFLEKLGFPVYGVTSWICGGEAIILVELGFGKLPQVKEHRGPPVYSENAEKFVEKYIESKEVVAGPFIKGNRWMVLKRRREVEVEKILMERITEVGLSPHVLKAVRESVRVYVGVDVAEACRDEEYIRFLYSWLKRREKWL